MPLHSCDEVSGRGPSVIFDLESLLLDPYAGMRDALMSVARACHVSAARVPVDEFLGCSRLSDVLAEIAGTDDASLLADLTQHYRRVYEQESRYRAPLLPGARELLSRFAEVDAELHYVSTLGPLASTHLVHLHGLQKSIATVYTPAAAVCPGARGGLLETFVRASGRAAGEYLLLSDGYAELATALRLGVPALALGYGRTPLPLLEALPGLLGIALKPLDVSDWLAAGALAQRSVRCTAVRGGTVLPLH